MSFTLITQGTLLACGGVPLEAYIVWTLLGVTLLGGIGVIATLPGVSFILTLQSARALPSQPRAVVEMVALLLMLLNYALYAWCWNAPRSEFSHWLGTLLWILITGYLMRAFCKAQTNK